MKGPSDLGHSDRKNLADKFAQMEFTATPASSPKVCLEFGFQDFVFILTVSTIAY